MMSGATQSAGRPSGRQPPGSMVETSKYCPSVMMNARPREMPITPSVAMKGGSLTSTTSAALRSPAARPTRTPRLMAGPSDQPFTTNSCAPTTPASAITAPGDRSTPPEMMTMAAPTAAIP